MEPIKVLLADDHTLIREGLKGLLEQSKEAEVIGFAENGLVAVELAEKLNPDVVVMDITMPELGGIEATKQIIEKNSDIKVVILSMHIHQHMVSEALKAGAIGYVLKDSAFQDLILAIKSAKANHPYFSPEIANIVLEGFLNEGNSDDKSSHNPLSKRETEIMKFLAKGMPAKEIAEDLVLSVKTVEKHRQRIMEKLDISSIAELTKYAIQKGYITLDDI